MILHFFFILTIFDFDFCRFSTFAVSRLSTFDSSTRRLAVAVGMFLGASISSDHFPSFENVENFVLS